VLSSYLLLLVLISDPEDRGDTFLRNVGSCTDYMALYPRRGNFHNNRCKNLKSYIEYTTFRKLNLFPSSGEGETPTLLGPLGRAKLNHWVSGVYPAHLRTEIDPVSETLIV
jgi:hypothetical protein